VRSCAELLAFHGFCGKSGGVPKALGRKGETLCFPALPKEHSPKGAFHGGTWNVGSIERVLQAFPNFADIPGDTGESVAHEGRAGPEVRTEELSRRAALGHAGECLALGRDPFHKPALVNAQGLVIPYHVVEILLEHFPCTDVQKGEGPDFQDERLFSGHLPPPNRRGKQGRSAKCGGGGNPKG
jgi:hypothetical protein